MAAFLESRVAELAAHAERRGINWQERTRDFSSDSRQVVAALATLLEIDAFEVLNEGRSLEELAELGRAAKVAEVELHRRAEEALRDEGEA